MKLRIGYDPDPKLTDADLLAIADADIVGELWPLLLKADAQYYVHSRDYAITADQRRYRLPMKTLGPITDVLYVDEDGNETSITVCNPEEVGHFRRPSACDYWHYIEGDFLSLFPTPNQTTGTLRIKYYRRPNTLCLSALARASFQLQFEDTYDGVGVLTTPAEWIAGTAVDLLDAGNAHAVLAEYLSITDIVVGFIGKSVRFAVGSVPTDIGDETDLGYLLWVAPTGYTPIVQVPDLVLPLLVARTAESALDSIGDVGGFQRANARASRLQDNAISTLQPRSEAEPNYIVSRNSPHRRRC